MRGGTLIILRIANDKPNRISMFLFLYTLIIFTMRVKNISSEFRHADGSMDSRLTCLSFELIPEINSSLRFNAPSLSLSFTSRSERAFPRDRFQRGMARSDTTRRYAAFYVRFSAGSAAREIPAVSPRRLARMHAKTAFNRSLVRVRL